MNTPNNTPNTDTAVTAPQFAAPEGTQAAVDAAQTDAAKAPAPERRELICSCCDKGDLVRKDKNGKPKLDEGGNVLMDRAIFLVLKPDGEPARQESGEHKRYHLTCAHAVRNQAPPAYRDDVEIITSFAFRKRKEGIRNEAGTRRKAAEAEGAEIWAGVKKTVRADGAAVATFADPKGPKREGGMAAALAAANGGKAVDPSSFGAKPGKGKRREKGDRRRSHDDD